MVNFDIIPVEKQGAPTLVARRITFKVRKLTGIILHVHTFCILFTQLNLLEYAGNISCVSNYIIRRAPDFVSARLQICTRKYIVLRKVHFCVSKKIYLLTQHIQSRFRNFY